MLLDVMLQVKVWLLGRLLLRHAMLYSTFTEIWEVQFGESYSGGGDGRLVKGLCIRTRKIYLNNVPLCSSANISFQPE